MTFPVAVGAMADLIRAHDWADTPLGPIEGWPPSLRTAVDIMLAAAAPVSVLWGPERIQLYNDAYISIAGDRHPAALGRPASETWAEAYEAFLGPVLDRVFAGEAVALNEQAVPLRGVRGEPVERVFAASFSPIYDGAGDVAGVFHPLLETTERVAAERELKAERDRTRAILDSLNDGYVFVDGDFRVLDINAEGLRLDGRPREEIVGRSHWEVFPASVGTPVEAAYRRAMSERVPVEIEHRYLDPVAGYDIWLDIRTYPSEGGLALFYRDITGRKRDEEALRRRSEQLQGLAEVAQAVTRAPTLEATLDEITQAARRIVGAHQGVVSLTRGPDWSQAINAVALTDKYAAWRDYAEMPGGDGIYAWLCEENRPVRFKQEELEAHPRWRGFGAHAERHPPMRGWLAAPLVGRDGRNLGLIQLSDKEDGGEFDEADEAMLVQLAQLASAAVEQTQAEAELALRAAEFEALAENVSQLAWMAEPDGSIYWYNKRWYDYTGTTLEQMQGWGWRDVHPPEAIDRVIAEVQANWAKGEPWEGTYLLRGKDGVFRPFLTRAEPIRDEAGRLLRWFGTNTDVTAQRLAEERLRELNETLEARVEQALAERDRAWNNARDLLLVVGTDGVFRAVNPAWTSVLGWSAEELVGRSYLEFIHPDDQPSSEGALATASVRELPTYENRYRHKDGSYRFISWVAAPEGELIYASGRDVTAERERQAELGAAQEALRQAQKMEAVGQLTGGLAHDFNNLLAGISGSLELIGSRLAQGRVQEVDRYLLAAQGAARRAAALTHRLLAFSRRQTLDPRPTDVNRLVAGMEELIRRTVGPAVAVEVVGARGLWPALVDPPQLESALLNLCINARDAMPEGGRITIETANTWLDRQAARQHDMPEGQYLSLCVTDTGTGMSAEVKARAFDPFFTTKPIGQGTGLGLSMIYGFAKQSGGQVRIYSEEGQGTTVCLYLPRHRGEGPAEDEDARAEARARSEGGQTVLVVDDEPTVRMLVTDVLEELGYTALEAGDSQEGLRILRSDARIDLLVTDVGLPGGLNGRQMADAGREARPGLRVLFITGYAENAALGHGQLAPGMAVLTKPFAMDNLAARIGELIAP